jgi:thioredoxin
MKWQYYLGQLLGIAAILSVVPGCSDLPTTGVPISGTPDGTAEVVVVSATGQIDHEEIAFLAAVDRKDQKLVLVDFWAPWCGPCLQLTPSIEVIKKKWGDKLQVVKVNVDENMPIASHLGIESIPNVRIFRNGTQVGDFTGVMPQDEIDALLRSLQ